MTKNHLSGRKKPQQVKIVSAECVFIHSWLWFKQTFHIMLVFIELGCELCRLSREQQNPKKNSVILLPLYGKAKADIRCMPGPDIFGEEQVQPVALDQVREAQSELPLQ